VGGSKVHGSGSDVTLAGAGVTLHECLKAAEILRGEDIGARVIDCYSVKPVDTAALAAAADGTSGRLVIAEDHHPEGGLGSAITGALLAAGRDSLAIAHLAVAGMPGSGTSQELLAWAGIDAAHIAAAARRLVAGGEPGA
jgi:transketolase